MGEIDGGDLLLTPPADTYTSALRSDDPYGWAPAKIVPNGTNADAQSTPTPPSSPPDAEVTNLAALPSTRNLPTAVLVTGLVAIVLSVITVAGSWHSLLIDNGAATPLLPALMLLASLTARRSLRHPRKRQAEAVVENRAPLLRVSPPRRFNHNLYENDRLNSWQRLTGCPGWLLLFYLMRWAIACYFEKGSRLLNVPAEQKALSVFSSDAVTWNDGAQPPSRRRYQPLCLAFHVGCRLLHLWHVCSITWTPGTRRGRCGWACSRACRTWSTGP